MEIGILATGNNEADLLQRFGSFADMTEQMFRAHDEAMQFRVFDIRGGEFPASAGLCEGWVITGSAASVYDDLFWIAPLERFIREIDSAGKPLIGLCFGHQIIARALGGSVSKAEAGWGLGLHSYSTTAAGKQLLNSELLHLHVIHQDQVIDPPQETVRLAGSDFCPNALLRYGNHILTVQSHPEFSLNYMQALMPAIAPEHISYDEAAEGLLSLEQGEDADPVPLIRLMIDLLRQRFPFR